MKTASFAYVAILAMAHGLTASALIVSSSNFERTGASLEPLNVEAPDSAGQNRPDESQSPSAENKFDKDKGTVKPQQNIDPGIVRPAPAPDPNSTPVITPPGTPGGAPGPEPK